MASVKTRQQIAAEATQRVIVEAAARLFLEHGYNATSVPKIAAEAGVAIQTIYNSIGSKRQLLSRVLDYAVAGDRAPTAPREFMRERTERETDPRRIVELIVEFLAQAVPRATPIFRVIREAAAVDPEAAGLEHARATQRLANYRLAAEILDQRDALPAEVTIDQAAATIFAAAHPDVYRALVLDGEWTHGQWAAWLQTTLAAALIGARASHANRR